MDIMIKLGIDIGASNVKLALLENEKVVYTKIKKISGDLINTVRDLVNETIKEKGDISINLGATGVGKDLLERENHGSSINEVMATACAISHLAPSAKTIIDLGAEFTKWIQVDGDFKVINFATNGLCAAGAGAFLEQQADRLKLTVTELAKIANSAEKGASIAGRCSVFAKSDMIHLQQKGTPVDEIAYGLCLALVRTFSATVVQGRKIETPLALVGGGAINQGLVRAIRDIFSLEKNDILIPELQLASGAIGAAMLADDEVLSLSSLLGLLSDYETKKAAKIKLVLKKLGPFEGDLAAKKEKPGLGKNLKKAYLGLDVGSVSTNLVLLNEDLDLIHGIYLPTKGRPVDVIRDGLNELESLYGEELQILGCGVTGSGRHLAAALVGADIVKNEITAQMTSSAFYFPDVETIFEIGGQDSKYITMKNGRLVDFEMNKICAAGTGSFLEEQAVRLGINIIGEFGALALKGDDPSDLGSQCTVFMDSELVSAHRSGASLENLCAGLSYSVVRNYLEKVVAHRPVGQKIVFQGGTASNKAVVAAFEKQLGRKIYVHPFNRISGAIGSAILAARSNVKKSNFRGFGRKSKIKVFTFECKSCSNLCQVSRLEIDKESVWFGDACDKFANKSSSNKSLESIEDITKLRESIVKSLLPQSYDPEKEDIGIVTGSLSQELLPLWANLVHELGFNPVYPSQTSKKTLRDGVTRVPSEVCMPLKIVAGQVEELMSKDNISKVFLPSVTAFPAKKSDPSGIKNLPDADPAHLCIFTQQIPFMLKRQWKDKTILAPQFSLEKYSGGWTEAVDSISTEFEIPRSKVRDAFSKAYSIYETFVETRREIGKSLLLNTTKSAMVLLGKPYNIYDSYLNMGLIRHLNKMGHQVIPMDFLPIDDVVLDTGSSRIPWVFNRDFLRAAKFISEKKNLFPLLISNFGCGPDAFALKHLETMWETKPYLALEFDEQRGEAGMVTRLEAFTDEIDEYNKREIDNVSPARPVFHRSNNKISRLFVPYFGPHTVIYTGMLKKLKQYDVIAMPQPDMVSIRMGEEISSGRECHPYTIIGGDIMRLVKEYSPRKGDAVFFMSTINPCLLSQYGDGYRLALRKSESPLEILDFYGSEMWDLIGYHGLTSMLEGLATVDSLTTLRYRFRPYEKENGQIDKLMDQALILVEDAMIAGKSTLDVLEITVAQLRKIDLGSYLRRPVVGLTGDMYTRIVPSANGQLIERLEEMGCEVAHSPFIAGLLGYSNYSDSYQWAVRGEAKPVMWEVLAMLSTESMMAKMRNILGSDYGPVCNEPSYGEVMEMIKPYHGERSNYLVSSTMGKFIDFAKRGVDGVINAIGINCMVGISAGSSMDAIRDDFDNIPMITLAYGGEEGVIQRLKLETFVHQVKEFRSNRGNIGKPMGLLADK
jgi:predicted CoA-substrate-specific enzyme activase